MEAYSSENDYTVLMCLIDVRRFDHYKQASEFLSIDEYSLQEMVVCEFSFSYKHGSIKEGTVSASKFSRGSLKVLNKLSVLFCRCHTECWKWWVMLCHQFLGTWNYLFPAYSFHQLSKLVTWILKYDIWHHNKSLSVVVCNRSVGLALSQWNWCSSSKITICFSALSMLTEVRSYKEFSILDFCT